MTKHYEQRKASNERYLAKFEQIQIRVPEGEKERIKAHADALGESLNGYIYRLIQQDMQRDNDGQQ